MPDITAYFNEINLSEDEYYTNMGSYIQSNYKFKEDVVLKENTSMYNPTFIIEHDFLATGTCNYCSVLWPGIGSFYYYFIEDVISTSFGVCEVVCKLDAFRTVPWRNAETKIQVRYSTRDVDWCTTCDEVRFEPYAPRGQYNSAQPGVRKQTFTLCTGSKEDGRTDVSVASTSTSHNYGMYLVKWYWGYNTDHGNLAVVYGAFNAEQYRIFLSDIGNYVANNPGSILGGVKDFLSLIISVWYFPSLGDQVFTSSGYTKLTSGVVVGNLATSSAYCYIRRDNAGFYNGWGEFWSGANKGAYFPLGAVNDRMKKMKFLVRPKWCKMIVDTPVGFGELPIDTLDMDGLYYNVPLTEISVYYTIDFEAGTMRIDFLRSMSSDGSLGGDTLLTLKGPIGLDVKNQTMRIQTGAEALLRAAPSIGTGAAGGMMTAGPIGAIGGALLGGISSLAAPRNINYASSSYNDITHFERWSYSIRNIAVRSYIYLNPDTPIYDNATYSVSGGWDAENVYTSYTNWCKQEYHGFPSIRYINCSGLAPSQETPTVPIWIQAQKVLDVYVYNFPHWCEDEIRKKLLNGVVIKNYSST